MSTSNDPRQAERVANLYRQVRALVDRVRPLHDSCTQLKSSGNGEKADVLWNAMNAEEREAVQHFPQYVEALEELRQGRMPPPAVLPASMKGHQLRGPVGATPKVGAVVVTHTQPSRRRRRGGRRTESSEPPQADEEMTAAGTRDEEVTHKSEREEEEEERESEEDEEIAVDVASLKTAEDAANALFTLYTADARERLLVLFVDQHMSAESTAVRDLAEAEAKLKDTENLKKRIVSGALKKPSKAQISEVEQLPGLRKHVHRVRKLVEREELKLRARVLELLDALEASSPSSPASSPASAEASSVEQSPDVEAATTESAARGAVLVAAQPDQVKDEQPQRKREGKGNGEEVHEKDAASERTAHTVPDESPACQPEAMASAQETQVSEDAVEMRPDKEEKEEEEEAAEEEEGDGTPDEEDEVAEEEGAAPAAPAPRSALTGFSEGNEWHKLVYTSDGFTMDTFRSLVRRPAKTAAESREEDTDNAAAEEAEAEAEKEETAAAAATPPHLPRYAEDKRMHYVRHHLGSRASADATAAPVTRAQRTSSCVSLPTDSDASGDDDSDAESDLSSSSSRHSSTGDSHVNTTTLSEKVPASLRACLHREWSALQESPLPRLLVRRASSTVWHVCVSPLDGPLCGVPLHLTVRFPTSYPFSSPKVRLDVAVPHPALMVSTSGEANTLFLTFRDPTCTARGDRNVTSWRADFGVRTLLLAVQNLFNADGFVSMRAALGEEAFTSQVKEARLRMARFASACPCCAPSSRAEYVNGPLLSCGSVTANETATESDAPVSAENDKPVPRPPLHVAGAPTVGGEATVVDGWLPRGPWRQCWAHLLLTEPHAYLRPHHLRLRVQSRGLSLATLAALPNPVLRLCEVPRDSAWRTDASPQGTPTANWASMLLSRQAAAPSTGDPSAPPLFTWSPSADAWRAASRPRLDGPIANAPPAQKKKNNAGVSNKDDVPEMVCELVVDIVVDGQSGGPCGTVDEAVEAATPAVRVVLPADPTATTSGGERLFAVVLEAAEGQSLCFHVAEGGAIASAFSPNPPQPPSLAHRLQLTWPTTAFYLMAPSAATAKAAAKARHANTGVLVALPYLPASAGAASGHEASYFIPHTVRFHLAEGQVPLVLSERAYLSNRHLILTRRRRRDGTFPSTEDGAPRDDYLASATEDVLQRALTLDAASPRAQSLSEVSRYFWGLRTVFIPLTRSWGRDDFGRTHALDRLKRTATQLYRHPAASVAYHPPFYPLKVLHLLSIVLHSVLAQTASHSTSTTVTDGFYTRLSADLVRTAVDLAVDSPAFLRLCARLVDAFVCTAGEEVSQRHTQKETAEQKAENATTRRRLFMHPPFMPLPTPAALTVAVPRSSTSGSAFNEPTEPDLTPEEVSEAALRLGELDVTHYLAHEDTMEATALYIAAIVVVSSARLTPAMSEGLVHTEQARLLTLTAPKAAHLLSAVTEPAEAKATTATETYTYVGAVPDAVCMRALGALHRHQATDEL